MKQVDSSGLVKSPFTISSATTGVTFVSSDFATSSSWTTILTYAVPLGVAVEITPVNWHFGYYYATDTTTQITAGLTKIEKQNANGTESRELWSGPNKIFKDIGDVRQRPNLRVPVILNASEKLVVSVKSLVTTFDIGVSDYFIEAMQYYEQV
jgi:hypothetical protein